MCDSDFRTEFFSELQKNAYEEGRTAFLANERLDTCPYWPEVLRNLWTDGWNDQADYTVK